MTTPTRYLRCLAGASAAALVAVCMTVAVVHAPGADAAVTPGVKPDFVLAPDSGTAAKQVTSVLVNDVTPQIRGNTAFTDWLAPIPTPDQCRTPAYDTLCDVYRIKVNRDTKPGAGNFVMLSVEWDRQTSTPALALAVAGLGDSDLPDIDLFLYANPKTYIDYKIVGGRGATIPERMAWTATQDEYDLVVRAGTGLVTGYRISAHMSSERFGNPFEFLDPQLSTSPPADHSGDVPVASAPIEATDAPALALAPIENDSQISGIGLGTNERFDPESLHLSPQTRTIAAKAQPPSTMALVLAVFAFPAIAGSGVAVALRRRRNTFIT